MIDAIADMGKEELIRRIENDEFLALMYERVILYWIKVGMIDGEPAYKKWESKLLEVNIHIQLLKIALEMK